MAMNWIKGLVAPPAFGQPAPGMQQPWPQGPQAQQPSYGGGGGPPVGGAPSPYGVQPMATDPQGALPPPPAQPQAPAYDPSGTQWSVGTKTQGATAPLTSSAVGGTTTASLEARCAQLQHDVESLALFARTLLTMLEENKLVTREQFDATKNRLDMLDGKLDDR